MVSLVDRPRFRFTGYVRERQATSRLRSEVAQTATELAELRVHHLALDGESRGSGRTLDRRIIQ